MIKKYIDYLHLKKEDVPTIVIDDYAKPTDIKLAERHLEYLKELYNIQRERQANIENKNSQLVGQASVIISIIALFVPLLIDKFSNINTFLFIIVIVAFIFVLFHYLVAIIHSIKTLQINHYQYSTTSTKTITKVSRSINEADFIKEEIEDLIYCIDKNSIQNNRKGSNLIFATRSFRIATIGVALFTLMVLSFSLSLKSESQKIEIESIDKSIIKEINLPIQEELNSIKNNNKIKYEKLNTTITRLVEEIDSLKNKKTLPNTVYKK